MDAIVFVAGAGTVDIQSVFVDLKGAIKMIDACEKNAVKRFILLSVKGVERVEEIPESVQLYLMVKKNVEDMLINSDLNYTIIRAGLLTDEMEKGTVTIGESIGDAYGEVSRMDLAKILVNCLESPNTYRKTLEVIGGQDPIEKSLQSL